MVGEDVARLGNSLNNWTYALRLAAVSPGFPPFWKALQHRHLARSVRTSEGSMYQADWVVQIRSGRMAKSSWATQLAVTMQDVHGRMRFREAFGQGDLQNVECPSLSPDNRRIAVKELRMEPRGTRGLIAITWRFACWI
jgi:hypothetical protein